MQDITRYRLKGSISLLSILVGGVFTNCDWCPDPDPNGAPVVQYPPAGDPHVVSSCPNELVFSSYASLLPTQCQGSDHDANPSVIPVGGTLKVLPNTVRKCPEGNYADATTAFDVFWTICNVANRKPQTDDIVQYKLEVDSVDASGNETIVKTIGFSQPLLDPCYCVDIAIGFNNGQADRALAAGTYHFWLTDIYEGRPDGSKLHAGFLWTTPQYVTIK